MNKWAVEMRAVSEEESLSLLAHNDVDDVLELQRERCQLLQQRLSDAGIDQTLAMGT